MGRLIGISLLILTYTSVAFSESLPIIDWETLKATTRPWERTEDWSEVPSLGSPLPQSVSRSAPPSDAVVLMGDGHLDQWQIAEHPIAANIPQVKALIALSTPGYSGAPAPWREGEMGDVEIQPHSGSIATKKSFGSVQLHLEWKVARAENKKGQYYGNSGVFFMGLYEVQILNSFENPTYGNGQAGSVYKQFSPTLNVSTPPGTWQSYDIVFRAPVFEEEQLVSPAYMTVFHNQVLIHEHVELQGPTIYIGDSHYLPHPEKLPLLLQDHGDRVSFRNIWLREL